MRNQETTNESERDRRAFLKTAGMGAAAVGMGPAMTKVRAGQTSKLEPDKIELLKKYIETVSPDQVEGIAILAHGLLDRNVALTPELAEWWLSRLDIVRQHTEATKESQRAEEEIHRQRDSLTGRDREDFVLELMQNKDHLDLYNTDFQREILRRVASGDVAPPAGASDKIEETYLYLSGKLDSRFEGCTLAFRRKVVQRYLHEVLPPLEAKQQAEQNEQEVYDNLLAAVGDKTLAEIATLTTAIEDGALDDVLRTRVVKLN